jgi:hypothetical protein
VKYGIEKQGTMRVVSWWQASWGANECVRGIGAGSLTIIDNIKHSFSFLDSTKNEESFEMTEERSRQWLQFSEGEIVVLPDARSMIF